MECIGIIIVIAKFVDDLEEKINTDCIIVGFVQSSYAELWIHIAVFLCFFVQNDLNRMF